MIDLAAARRKRKARDDGRCACGHYRAVCSPYGQPCVYHESFEEAQDEYDRQHPDV